MISMTGTVRQSKMSKTARKLAVGAAQQVGPLQDRCLDRFGLLQSKFPGDTLKEIPFAEQQLPSTLPDNEGYRIKVHLKTNEGWAAAL